jgi:hypothetical protein
MQKPVQGALLKHLMRLLYYFSLCYVRKTRALRRRGGSGRVIAYIRSRLPGAFILAMAFKSATAIGLAMGSTAREANASSFLIGFLIYCCILATCSNLQQLPRPLSHRGLARFGAMLTGRTSKLKSSSVPE